MENGYLDSVIKQFEYYKLLGEKTINQLSEEQLQEKLSEDSNNIVTIVKHLHGNMMSRWTDFLTSDGEKEWRQRDGEFETDNLNLEQIMALWQAGWHCFLSALQSLTEKDLTRIIYIRNQGHTVLEAINRQLAHYPYHVGQMVFIGKILAGASWQSLSIPKNKSTEFNAEKFNQEKKRAHFTDDDLKNKKIN